MTRTCRAAATSSPAQLMKSASSISRRPRRRSSSRGLDGTSFSPSDGGPVHERRLTRPKLTRPAAARGLRPGAAPRPAREGRRVSSKLDAEALSLLPHGAPDFVAAEPVVGGDHAGVGVAKASGPRLLYGPRLFHAELRALILRGRLERGG